MPAAPLILFRGALETTGAEDPSFKFGDTFPAEETVAIQAQRCGFPIWMDGTSFGTNIFHNTVTWG